METPIDITMKHSSVRTGLDCVLNSQWLHFMENLLTKITLCSTLDWVYLSDNQLTIGTHNTLIE